jgi:xylono-1,5-lactonase
MYSKLLLQKQCALGEGLHWDSQRDLLWFVDINSKELMSFDLDTKKLSIFSMPEKIGWVITKINSSDLVVGLKSGIALFNPEKGLDSLSWINKNFPTSQEVRLNDAKADEMGRIWAGSLNEENDALLDGCLVKYELNGQPIIMDKNYYVANGPAIHAINQKLFHTDSSKRIIYEFKFDAKRGLISNKKRWKVFEDAEGHPDGMCFDQKGFGLLTGEEEWLASWMSMVRQLHRSQYPQNMSPMYALLAQSLID